MMALVSIKSSVLSSHPSHFSLQTIVRGSKMGVGGSLTWLLDEFDTMSVTRSNSLRRGSPPIQPRKDSISSGGGGQENGDPHHRHYSHPDRWVLQLQHLVVVIILKA